MASRRGSRYRTESPPKKRNALVQMLLREDGEVDEVPEQFNIVQEYSKLRQELLSRVQPPEPVSRTRRCLRTGGRQLVKAGHSPSRNITVGPARKKKNATHQKISRPYTEMMQRRIEHRRKLLEYLSEGGKEDEDPTVKMERRERRYRRYIQHGIGTEHIAPLQQSSIDRISALLPTKLKRNFKDLLQTLLAEVQQEFVLGVKIAVVEYVLHADERPTITTQQQPSTAQLRNEETRNAKQRSENSLAAHARKQKIQKIRLYISKNLHIINKCIAQVLDLWHKSFSSHRLINIQQFSELEHALELPAFKNLISHQIHAAVQHLRLNWFPALETIFLQCARKRLLPTSARHLTNLFESLATVMTAELQQLIMDSIKDFTDFICDDQMGHNRGFILEVAYRNKLIIFEPSFATFRQEMLHVLEMLRDALQYVPRLEAALPPERMPAVLPSLPDNKLFLKPVIPSELLSDAQTRLIATLEEQRILPELRIQDFDAYISLINGEWQEDVDRFLNTRQLQGYEEQVTRVSQLHALNQSLPCDVSFVVGAGLFEVHRGPLVIALVQAATTLRDLLLASMRSDHLALSTQLSEEYESIASRALSSPANTAELMALKAYVAQVESNTVLELEERLRQLCQSMLFLVDHTTVSPAEVKQNAAPFQWYAKMPAVFAEHQDIVQKKTAEYQQALRVRTKLFEEALELQERQVTELQHLGDISELPRYLQRARTLQTRLHAALSDIEQFNAEEIAFGWETSQYPLREEIAEKLGPYLELYETSSGFLNKHELWMSSRVGAFHPAEIETEVEGFWQTVHQLEKTFADITTVKLLILKVRQKIEEFRDNLPVVQTLGNPDMKERHWEKVSEIVGFPLKADESLTLAKIIDFGLGDYNSKFQIISESATKENNLEKALNQMVAEWAEMEFSVVPYRESGTHFLSSVDDIQLLLDDHIVKTQTMRGSPYIKPFEKDIIEWEANLMLLQEILDSWIKVQGSWMYLEPIFSSPDIQAQMPEEGRRFGAVDKMWRDIMKVVLLDLRVLVVARIEKMLERLHKSSDLLDAIQRGLNDYLDKKRVFFPRFFFLSNDELLEILSETKDPTRVQPHLKKCFRGVAQLNFTEDMAVASVVSAQGEEVTLCEIVDTASSRGQVEQWLQQLERAIKTCVHKMLEDAHAAYETDDKHSEWLTSRAGQAVLCISQVKWTEHVHEAVSQNTLSTVLQKIEKTVNNEVKLLRSETLALHQRTKLGSLITQDLYSKQVTAKLVDMKIQTVDDFEFTSKLRQYWENGHVYIRMLNATLQYGYEYLGDCTRLVMTPQTIKCFQTIFGALRLNLGAILEGPTGSGKTETIKDLANVVAKQCALINCSTGLDCISLGKFLKGAASSGAWICLDELDRLSVETLSALAHQILAIQRGIRAKASTILLEGSSVSLEPTCVTLATLSPQSHQVEKLPSNLKSLLRPLLMTVPNFEIISEIILFSNGFQNAANISKKIHSSFKLCARQMSQEKQYDHGLRTIKAVLASVIKQKQLNGECDEEKLIIEALNFVNESKYLEEDLAIFQEIITSTFQEHNSQQNNALIKAIKKSCQKRKLECTTQFQTIIEQLYNQVNVRHGIILLGPPFSGKTTAYQILASSLASMELQGEHKVQTVVINPRALTLHQLYGKFDPISHEWSDGVLAICFRQLATSISLERKWLIFDGPIDSTWVENLNTVLDDNKRMFLMSGENCHLPGNMNFIFETSSLSNASPSIISRCGVVYVDDKVIGWRPLLTCWINTLPSVLQEQKDLIVQLFERFVPPLLGMRQRNTLKSLFPPIDSSLVRMTMSLFDCYVNEFTEEKLTEGATSLDLRAQIEGVFFYSCIWSMGGGLDAESRIIFDEIFRSLLAKEFPLELKEKYNIIEDIDHPAKPYIFQIPERLTVFDYRYFNEGKGKWRPWEDEVRTSPGIPRDIPVNQILVATLETIRCATLLHQLISHGKPLILVGPTGVGKTSYVTDFLNNKVDKNIYKPLFILFSANTLASEVQELVMNNLDKRRKGVYGPPLGKRCLMFVDDVNLPERDSGSQPPVELLRQLLDHGSWFDCTSGTPLRLMDLQLVCAMGPSPRGLQGTSQRFLRHFCAISINELEETVLISIFSRLMLWHLDTRGFSKEFDPSIDELVAATLNIYKESKAVLLPIPNKTHYIFNLRDFSRVIQGVLLSVPEAIEDLAAMKRLWVHEVLRVFGDRIWDKSDREWLLNVLRVTCKNILKNDMDVMFKHLNSDETQVGDIHLRKLMFCDFFNPKADSRNYGEVPELDHLRSTIERFSNEYNNMSKKPTTLTMFQFAMEHLSRICRVLKQPRNHALLIGCIGSGRQCLARVAAHLSYYELYQPEVTKAYKKAQWREELKELIIKTGTSDQNMVLLFTDSQAKSDYFFEDINHLLCLGEIPNLISAEEKTDIIEKMGQIDKQRDKTIQTDGSNIALFNFYLQKLRDQLHLIICMNPKSLLFEERLRKFPSLLNCCTINWFMPWPEDALEDVASNMLADFAMEETQLQSCLNLCQKFHTDAQLLSVKARQKYGISSLVIPASYIELLSTFRKLMQYKQDLVKGAQERYETAVKKILDAEEQVPTLQVEITNLQPQLKTAAEAVEHGSLAVDNEARDVAELEQVVNAEEEVVNAKRTIVQELQVESETGISEALPALQDAMTIMESLPLPEIVALRGTKNPPKNLKLLMEAICVIKDIKGEKIANPAAPGRSIDDYWGPGKKLLGDSKFIESLLLLDKDNVPIKASKQIAERILSDESFEPEKLRAISTAAEGLCRWVIALYNYDCAAKLAAPKKQLLAEASDDLQIASAALEEKRTKLQAAQSQLSDLRAEFVQAQAHREQLQNRYELSQKKLKRSEELLGSLRGETDYWTKKADTLSESYKTIIGDVLVCAGIIAYLGPFLPELREEQTKIWVQDCSKLNFTCSTSAEQFSLCKVLGDPVELRDWGNAGLPCSDNFCMDSAIITRHTGQWPLMIDPDGQANKWVRAIEAANQLQIARLNDSDYFRTLESCVQTGKPVLLENIGEELDSLLEPLLLKQYFKQGSSLCIKLGESVIEYNPEFRLYISTCLRKPNYSDEISSKVALVNFSITKEGLQEELLSITVARERPDLESEKTQLLLQSADNKRQLRDLEYKIIEELSLSQGNILEDEACVQLVATAKTQINEMIEKQNNTEQTEVTIDRSRQSYDPIASHASALYCSVTKLETVNPMYQFSLSWFTDLFKSVIDSTERVEDVSRRLQDLAQQFNIALYRSVSICLFDKDKLLFALLLTKTMNELSLDQEEWKFLLLPHLNSEIKCNNPHATWLPEENWQAICSLNELSNFKGIKEHIANNISIWQEYFYDNEMKFKISPWNENLENFQQLLILKCLRPHVICLAIHKFIQEKLGEDFINPPSFNFASLFAASNCRTPLIFMHSSSIDPTASLLKFADDMRVSQKMQILSLGEDQGAVAHRIIEDAMKNGSWILIQNCHLELKWMPTLEKICDGLGAESTHPEFRLWLASVPSKQFSPAILQIGIKMAYDPSTNLRDNILRSYQSDPVADSDFYESSFKLNSAFRKLVYGMCLFHALVLERRNFHSIGWNHPYNFTESDLRASLFQMHSFISDAKEKIPYNAIQYLTSECYYGGLISDPWDQRCLKHLLMSCCGPELVSGNFNLDMTGLYKVPTTEQYDEQLKRMRNFPLIANPNLFGLNENVAFLRGSEEALSFLKDIAATQDGIVLQNCLEDPTNNELRMKAETILECLPQLFPLSKMKEAQKQNDPIGRLLLQEAKRYNNLLFHIQETLQEVALAAIGHRRMSPELKSIAKNIVQDNVPQSWKAISYPTLKNLGGYVIDLTTRLKYVQDWYENSSNLTTFNIGGFFFPLALFTAIEHEFMIKNLNDNIITIDNILFDCEIMKSSKEKTEIGVIIKGFFLHGAKWDHEKWCLGESDPRVLYDSMPEVWLKPSLNYDEKKPNRFICPVYQTSERGGILNSAGVSTNFLNTLPLTSEKAPSHWILRGTAIICQIP